MSWALALLLALGLGHPGGDAQILSHTIYDQNWLPIDVNFPSTVSRPDARQVERFYYKRGVYTQTFKPTDQTLAEVDIANATAYHVRLQYWSNDKPNCIKGVRLWGTKTNLEYTVQGEWNDIRRDLGPGDSSVKDFNVTLYTSSDCQTDTPPVMTAVRAPTLAYNSYKPETEVEPNLKPDTMSSFKRFYQPPTSTTSSASQRFYFYDCCCGGACWLNLTFDKSTTKTFEINFWHAKGAELVRDGKTLAVTTTSAGWSSARIELNDAPLSLAVNAIDSSIVSLELPAELQSSITTTTSQALAAETFTKKMATLLESSNDWPTLILPGHVEDGVAEWDSFGKSRPQPQDCFEVDYVMQSEQQMFSLYLQQFGEHFVQSYPLFDWIAQPSTAKFQFCLQDMLYSSVLQHPSATRLVLTTRAPRPDGSGHQQVTVLQLQPSQRSHNPQSNINFFNKDTLANTWATIVPDQDHDGKNREQGLLNIENLPRAKLFQLHSIWIKNTAKLSETPATILLRSTIATLFGAMTMNVSLCDEVMECVPMQLVQRRAAGQNEMEYDFRFDSHPNRQSQMAKLLVAVMFEASAVHTHAQLRVVVANFGDPCRAPSPCPAGANDVAFHYECKGNNPTTVDANDFAAVCKCKHGWTGVNCELEDFCADKTVADCAHGCRNNRHNDGFECICLDGARLQQWTGDKCQVIAPGFHHQDATLTWTFDLSTINTNIYDVCYVFETVEATADMISGTFQLKLRTKNRQETILDERTINVDASAIAPSINICLNQLANVRGLDSTDGLELIATMEAKNAPWKSEDSYLAATTLELTQTNIQDIYAPDSFLSIPDNFIEAKEQPHSDGINHVINFNPEGGTREGTLYSGWYSVASTPAEMNANVFQVLSSLPKEVLEYRLFVCRPRLANTNNCHELSTTASNNNNNNNNWYHILTERLNTAVFQLRAQFTVSNMTAVVEQAAGTVIMRAAIHKACQIQSFECQHQGVCISEGTHRARCNCENTGHVGEHCEIDEKHVCTDERQVACAQVNSVCQATGTEEATCSCITTGFRYNHTANTCQRLKVRPEVRTCGLEYDAQCWLTNIDEGMSYLPRYFPHIFDPKDGRNKGLYYSLQSGSRLSINVDYKSIEASKRPNMDICFRFRHMLAAHASLRIVLETSAGGKTIELFELEADKAIASGGGGGGHDLRVDLSEVQTLCLQSLVHVASIEDQLGDVFKVTFITHSPDAESTVALQIVSTIIVHLKPKVTNSNSKPCAVAME